MRVSATWCAPALTPRPTSWVPTHRLTKFLLRVGQLPPAGVRPWTQAWQSWLSALHFQYSTDQVVFEDYRAVTRAADDRGCGASRLRCAWASPPPIVVAILVGLALVVALVHYLNGESRYWQARHLYPLKMMSFRTGRAPLAATAPPEPDFEQLDAHFPGASTVYHSAWALRTPTESGPDLRTPTEEDKALWTKSRPALSSVRSAVVLPGTCYRCRRWIWPYRALAKLPPKR
ncbi:MAG TPA: hypothetical protein VMW80_04885 [Candidatus Dormibacteraeota bacterium]|nr:hypothetical protein [Candidatus Dormibacteraeota bacterium]